MANKNNPLDHHLNLGVLLLLLMVATIPLFIWAMNQDTSTLIRAYYPRGCKVPQVPRTQVCSTDWQIERDENNCRIFVCKD